MRLLVKELKDYNVIDLGLTLVVHLRLKNLENKLKDIGLPLLWQLRF